MSYGQILGACQGSGFEDKPNEALIRILFDIGARRHEVAAPRYSPTDPDDRDVDVRRATVRVLGKGGKNNIIAVLDRTLSALEREPLRLRCAILREMIAEQSRRRSHRGQLPRLPSRAGR